MNRATNWNQLKMYIKVSLFMVGLVLLSWCLPGVTLATDDIRKKVAYPGIVDSENVSWFIQATDIHIGKHGLEDDSEDVANLKTLTNVITSKVVPSCVVITGDLTESVAGLCSQQSYDQWDKYKSIIITDSTEQFRSICLDIPGNHDRYGDPEWDGQYSDGLGNVYPLNGYGYMSILGSQTRSSIIGQAKKIKSNVAYITVNTCDENGKVMADINLEHPSRIPVSDFPELSTHELADLELMLIASQGNIIFVFGHHSIITNENHIELPGLYDPLLEEEEDDARGAKSLVTLLNAYNVLAYVYGHTHENSVFRDYYPFSSGESCTAIQINTSCLTYDGDEPNSYRIVSVDNNGMATIPCTLDDTPALIITSPVSKDLENGLLNPYSNFIIPKSHYNPIRALCFSFNEQDEPLSLEYRVTGSSYDSGWHSMSPVDGMENLYQGFWNSSFCESGEYTILVRVKNASGQVIKDKSINIYLTAWVNSLTIQSGSIAAPSSSVVVFGSAFGLNNVIRFVLNGEMLLEAHPFDNPLLDCVESDQYGQFCSYVKIPSNCSGDYYLGAFDREGNYNEAKISVGGISVTAPNGSEQWQVDEVRNVTWSSTGTVGDNVKIEISRNSGSTWATITDSTPNDGSYSWTVTEPTSQDCLVRVKSTSNNEVQDVSNAKFAILMPCIGHDLAITSLTSSKTAMKPSENTTITATILNKGENPEINSEVNFVITGPDNYSVSLEPPITIPSLEGGNHITYAYLTWPGTMERPSTDGTYVVKADVLSAEQCDEHIEDNSLLTPIYVSQTGDAPTYTCYIYDCYQMQYGEDKNIGVEDKIHNIQYLGQDLDNTSYWVSIDGGSKVKRLASRSYYTSDNAVIYWCRGYLQTGEERAILLMAGYTDDKKDFDVYEQSVTQGGTVTYTSSQIYDDDLVYRYNLTSNYMDLWNEPSGSYSTSGTSVFVNTAGLAPGQYGFAIWSDDYSPGYVAFGKYNVIAVSYILNLQKGGTGNGQVRVNGTARTLPYSASFTSGTSMSLVALADAGSRFTNWSGDVNSTSSSTSFSMTGNKNITANFAKTYTLSITGGGTGSGQVKVNSVLKTLPCSMTFDFGTVVNLEAVAGSGSIFDSWSGGLDGNGNPETVTMNEAKSVNANFSLLRTVTMHINPVTAGVVSVNGSPLTDGQTASFRDDDSVSLLAIANNNYAFQGWSGDANGSDNPFLLSMDGNRNVTAAFVEKMAPTVSTGSGTLIDFESARLEGIVNPNAENTVWRFEYGAAPSYTTMNSAGSGTVDVPVSGVISSLTVGNSYPYRLTATNINGTSNGEEKTYVHACPDATVLLNYILPCTCIQGAYDASLSGDVIVAKATDLNENLIFDQPKSVLLRAGWNETFTDQISQTKENSITISDGSVVIESICIGGGINETDWIETSSLDTPLNSVGAAFVENGYIYCPGGWSTERGTFHFAPINSDGTLGTWGPTTSMPNSHHTQCSATSYNGAIYLVGGHQPNWWADEVYYTVPNSDGTVPAWYSATSLPVKKGGSGTFGYNGYLYTTGGTNGSSGGANALTEVRFALINTDGSIGNWIASTSLPTGRTYHGATAYKGYAYIAGGVYAGLLSANETLYAPINSDGTIGAWNTTSSLPVQESDVLYYGAKIYAVDDYLYLLSGCGKNYRAAINTDGSLGSWESWKPYNFDDYTVSYFSTYAYNPEGKMFYALGGMDNGIVSDQVYFAQIP